MTRTKALRLAQEEIDKCKSTNMFIRDEIDDLYNDLPVHICIQTHEDVVREAFADYFMVKDSPLWKILHE